MCRGISLRSEQSLSKNWAYIPSHVLQTVRIVYVWRRCQRKGERSWAEQDEALCVRMRKTEHPDKGQDVDTTRETEMNNDREASDRSGIDDAGCRVRRYTKEPIAQGVGS